MVKVDHVDCAIHIYVCTYVHMYTDEMKTLMKATIGGQMPKEHVCCSQCLYTTSPQASSLPTPDCAAYIFSVACVIYFLFEG